MGMTNGVRTCTGPGLYDSSQRLMHSRVAPDDVAPEHDDEERREVGEHDPYERVPCRSVLVGFPARRGGAA